MTASAAELLERMRLAYASCESYRDTGEVVTVFVMGALPFQRRTARKPFSTLFVRPNLFRFEFREATVGPESEWHGAVVWTDGDKVASYNTISPGIGHRPTILEALAGPTGVSSGSAIRIPRLLIPNDHWGWNIPVPETATVEEAEMLEGDECVRVSGPTPRGQTINLWIATQTGLIHRVTSETVHDQASRDRMRRQIENAPGISAEHRAAFLERHPDRSKDFRTEDATFYRPEANVEIPPELFTYTPPQ